MVTASAPLDLGTYRNFTLIAQPDNAAGWTLQAIGKNKTHELAITDYTDEASPAMKAAWTRLAQKLEHPDDQPVQTASTDLIAKIAGLREHLSNNDTRLINGKWQHKYALHIEEVKYLAQVQRSSKDRAAILSYADRRLQGAVAADGTIRWNPFNDDGMPTFYFDDDLGIEDTLYFLWQNTKDLMTVFNDNPPALPYPVDEPWLAAMTTPRAAQTA